MLTTSTIIVTTTVTTKNFALVISVTSKLGGFLFDRPALTSFGTMSTIIIENFMKDNKKFLHLKNVLFVLELAKIFCWRKILWRK